MANTATANGGSHSTAESSNGTSNNIQSHPRHAYAKAILGKELFGKIASSRILVVGAGGIGCELLKNLVLVGFGHVEVIDLDTIDLSNLNRQFLFQKVHIGKPKSLVATSTALQFNPLIDIKPHHSNVKDTSQFGWEYFEQFDVVCNALDNLDARRWVNKMCIMTGVPLVESGTTGFLGQVQPIARGTSECYDCVTKPTPKTYPVCTIRSTPSTPIHCIVWAKTYLFPQLFGAEEESEDAELDKALQDGENADEVANLRREAREMRALRDTIFQTLNTGEQEEGDLSKRVFNKVFKADVERLLSMEDMWRKRTKPVPLDFDVASQQEVNGDGNGVAAPPSLRDQKVLSLQETVEQFDQSLKRLAKRARDLDSLKKESLSFDKDDVDAMDFVTATANLRSRIYHIAPQSRFQVKEMAGNIIPAIASTNAIIAGAQVLQTLHALRKKWSEARFVSLNRTNASRLISSTPLEKPNAGCGVCQDDYVRAKVDIDRTTLADVKEAVLQSRQEGGLGFEVEGMELYEGARLLADEDFDDNLPRTLASLGITLGMMITCADEDGVKANVNIYISARSKGDAEKVDFGVVNNLPVLRAKPTLKRPHPDSDDSDDDVVEEVQAPAGSSAAPKRKREDDEASAEPKKAHANGDANKKAKVTPHTGAREEEAIELD